jgi:nucleotide-binding universal stress UspA family protein
MPSVDFPDLPGWTWEMEVRSGDVIQTILDTAESIDADLIVMATDGRNGFLDGLRGSHSERVLRHASAPLLTVPAGSYASDVLG